MAEREAAPQHSRGQRRQRALQPAERGEIQPQALEQQELKEKRKKA